MGGYIRVRCSPSVVGCRLSLRWAVVSLSAWVVLVASVASADRASLGRRPGSPSVGRGSSAIAVCDAVLCEGGVLQGVVLSASTVSGVSRPVVGVRVSLLREGKIVAESVSGQLGRFTVSGLRGGKYVIAVAYEKGVEWALCRVWTPGAAPPKAMAVVRVTLGSGLVRGQGPVSSVSFSEAALMAGVVVGAVAAPVIYHNTQKSNRVPASP